MKQAYITLAAVLVSFTIFVASLFYGPVGRIFVSPPRVQQVSSVEDINRSWRSAQVSGRILAVFSRSLGSAPQGTIFSEYIYTNLAIHDGIVRTVYHIVPDSMWPEVVAQQIQCCPDVRPTGYGFVLSKREGRVHFLPLSRFFPINEEVLMVLDLPTWSSADLESIEDLIRSHKLKSDIVTVRGGSPSDLSRFNSLVLSSTH